MSKLKLFLEYLLTPILSLSKVGANKLSDSVLNKANANVNLKTPLIKQRAVSSKTTVKS